MIGKVASIGTSFLGTLEYCYYATRPNRSLDRSQIRGELVYFQHVPASTVTDSKKIKGCKESPLNLEKMSERMQRIANLNRRVEKPVWHQAFSFPVGEKVDTETMAEICQLFAQRFGMENNQLVAFRHADKDHDHFHIIANRINLDELDIEKISDSYDYVFFDLGGRFDESIIRTLRFADLVLVPFTTQNIDVMASLEYCLTLADHVKQGHLSDSTQFYCFWNKYKFTFQKKAELIESQLKTKFAAKGLFFDFLETRLNDADSGFDRAKMWTTISSPIQFKGGQYLNGIARFAEEVIKLSNYQNN